MSELHLQETFPDATREDWRALAEAGLRGKPFSALVSETEDGLRRGPLFDARSDAPALPRAGAPLLDGRPWHVCAVVSDADLSFANTQLLEDLNGGASAVRIEDIPVTRRADLRRVLEGVHLDLVPIVFAPNSAAAAFARDMDELKGCAVTLGLASDADGLETMVADLPQSWRAVTVDGAAVHARGGTDALELATVAAGAAQAVRRLGSAGAVAVQIATHADAHLSICKTRAARRVVDAVVGAFGHDDPLPIHAVTGARMMQGTDAWTNLLRVTSAAFGAVVGGADYVMTRAFTDPLGAPTPFARRIARNQQILMMEESRLGQVADAAHGSYFHESLTEAMAAESWAIFQEIERAGGLAAFDMDAAITKAVTERESRDEPVLGVTLHPVPDDVPVPDVRGPKVRS